MRETFSKCEIVSISGQAILVLCTRSSLPCLLNTVFEMLLGSKNLFCIVFQTFIAPFKRVRLRAILLPLSLYCKATDIALGKRPNRVTKHPVVASDVDPSEYDLYPSESDSSSVSSSSSEIAPDHTSEMQELMSAIRIGIDGLFKASIFIRNSASTHRRLRAEETKTFNNCADVMHVRDRYPLLKDNPTLIFRLGEANARRRQHFKYFSDHDERLATASMKDDWANVKAQVHPGVVSPETAMTVLTGETKPSLLADTVATTFVADDVAQARLLEMPAAQEANSVASFATSIAETLDEDLPFPPVPAEAKNGSSFYCPYCCINQELKHEGVESQWRYEKICFPQGLTNLPQKACPQGS